MKAILEFDLPEDKEDFDYAVNAFSYRNVCWEFTKHLRSEMKYGMLSDEEHKVYDKIITKFFDIWNDNVKEEL